MRQNMRHVVRELLTVFVPYVFFAAIVLGGFITFAVGISPQTQPIVDPELVRVCLGLAGILEVSVGLLGVFQVTKFWNSLIRERCER